MNLNNIGPLRIGGYWIPIEVDNPHCHMTGLLGRYAGDDTKIIQRDDNLPAQVVAETNLHEVLHGIAEIYMEGTDVPETTIAMLAQGLFQVMGDNPDWVFFVSGGYEEPEIEGDEECVT
tara:strand:- start:1694 stop:2050 length:357 start_codon:yes stop_codon:yes gene_type:complete